MNTISQSINESFKDKNLNKYYEDRLFTIILESTVYPEFVKIFVFQSFPIKLV